MQVIKIEDLYKTFKTYKRKKGFIGSIQTLFTKEYITVNAVDGVSFGIDQGEIVGYVGPNGAGKSTTIKMLTGILYPTSGVIEVCGLVPDKGSEAEFNAYRRGLRTEDATLVGSSTDRVL